MIVSKKDVYYRLLKNEKYNWRKLLLLSSAKLIKRLHILQKNTDTKVATWEHLGKMRQRNLKIA